MRRDPAPVRKSREGEVLPKYFGLNCRYGLWFRQLRRLQSLCLRKGSTAATAVSDRADTWHAVTGAQGFQPWRTRHHRLLHALDDIPAGLPSLDDVQAISQCFEVNFRSFERDLLAHRRALAKARRAHMPSLIFRDVQRPRACPVTTLVEGPQARIVQVDPEDFSVEVDQEQSCKSDTPVLVDGKPFMPLRVEADKIWLDRPPPDQTRRVHQETHLATLTAGLFANRDTPKSTVPGTWAVTCNSPGNRQIPL